MRRTLLGLSTVFALIWGGCEITHTELTEPLSEKIVKISALQDSFQGGLTSVWFRILDGETFPWGPDSLSEPPDSLQTFFKITPGLQEFKSLEIQNSLHFGALLLGTGDSVYNQDYWGDSLDLKHDLALFGEIKKDNVYYLRNQLGACQIKIVGWDADLESLTFEWRTIDSVAHNEDEQTLELPEEGTEHTVYFFNIKDASVLPVAQDDSLSEPSAYEFRIDPGESTSFTTPFYTDTLPFGIAYLGLGNEYYDSQAGWDNRLTHKYQNFISKEHFEFNAVFYLRTYQGDCTIMITEWDKSKSILRFKWHMQPAPNPDFRLYGS